VVQSPAGDEAKPDRGDEAWTGQATGEEPEAHENSDQVLLLVAGELSAEIGGKRSRMRPGDVVIIPPRLKHKFTNHGEQPAVTFNVYSPPEYRADQKR
jgi:mannose-6-phosphate isomerase-like protein (cupin superfamily)